MFGRTMECVRKGMDLELVTNQTRAKKLIAKPTTLHWDIISDNLVSVREQKPKIIVDRPIYLGFCILKLSKITMCRFHYEEILHKYGSRAKLAYTDADSFIYDIQTHDIYKDMAGNLEAYETSDYPVDHPLHSKRNAKVLGKMKDKCSSLALQEFVVPRAKMYSILFPYGKPKCTAKGVSRRYILKHLHHKDYLRTLKGTESTIATFSTIRSLKQQINTLEVTKKFLTSFDDKRYILNDAITTLAYGHYKIAQMKST